MPEGMAAYPRWQFWWFFYLYKLSSKCSLFHRSDHPSQSGITVSLSIPGKAFQKKGISKLSFSISLQCQTEELQQSSLGNPHYKRGDSKLLIGNVLVLLNCFWKGSAKMKPMRPASFNWGWTVHYHKGGSHTRCIPVTHCTLSSLQD